MKVTHWVILIGILSWLCLLVVGYTSHSLGEFISRVFNGTTLEQTGRAITAFGDTAFAAFWMVVLMACIVVVGIAYFKARAAL